MSTTAIGKCAYCGPECDHCRSAKKLADGQMELRVTRDKVANQRVLRCSNWLCYLKTVDSNPPGNAAAASITSVEGAVSAPSTRNAWETHEARRVS